MKSFLRILMVGVPLGLAFELLPLGWACGMVGLLLLYFIWDLSKVMYGLVLLSAWNIQATTWFYDWGQRIDQAGKPAGIFTNTPYAIDETMSTYSITNDEGIKTYNLGTIAFVDNQSAAGNTYNPATRTQVGGTYTSYTTLSAALSAVANGNKTILVRSGTTYSLSGNVSFTGKTGTDPTHRYSVIGYKQERPIFDGGGFTMLNLQGNGVFGSITIQRLQCQNSTGDFAVNGDSAGPTTLTNVAMIDMFIYNYTSVEGGGDGGVHYENSDNGWLYHCSILHTYDHGIKYSDGLVVPLTAGLIEWNTVTETGYWSGLTSNATGTACGIDCVDTFCNNITIRYNISTLVLFDGIQLRNCAAIVHHNETQQFMAAKDIVTNSRNPSTYDGGISFNVGDSVGDHASIYANLVHDSLSSGTNTAPSVGIGLACHDASNFTSNFNNVVYGVFQGLMGYGFVGDGGNKKYVWYNNSVYPKNGGTAGFSDAGSVTPGAGDVETFQNNIFYAPSAVCVNFDSDVTKTNNLYYYPSGSRGYPNPLETGGVEANPLFISVPSGAFVVGNMALQETSPAVHAALNLSTSFTTDFNSRTRVVPWDIGAMVMVPFLPTVTNVNVIFTGKHTASGKVLIQ